jgi:C4-dicarboxylate transporter DctM subunit
LTLTVLLTFFLVVFGLALTLPMFIVLIGASFTVVFLSTSLPLSILPQRVFAGLESFPLLAIPFFIFAANLMGQGGLSERIIQFIRALVGHLPGGLALTSVVTCILFGAITGSSASTIVAVGGLLYPALVRAGYPEHFSLGLVTCSALIGMIIPPSNAMIVYGAVANVSIGALFMSGIGAGALFSLIYASYCVGASLIYRVPRDPRANLSEILLATRRVLWGIGMPIVILGGLYGGVFTATEAATVSVFYAMFVTMLVYRTVNIKQLWKISEESALATARILIMVGAASLFSYLLTVTGITSEAAESLRKFNNSPDLLLLSSNLMLLVGGMFLDVFSNILIFVPILLGIVSGAGVGPIHFGIITTVNVDIGNITPPFGLNLFVSSGTFNKPYTFVVRATIPWLILALISLLIITYFPSISLWLPKQIYFGVN